MLKDVQVRFLSWAHIPRYAEIAQLVEHNLAKVGVASSSLVFRSRVNQFGSLFFVLGISLHKLRIFLHSMMQIVDKFAV